MNIALYNFFFDNIRKLMLLPMYHHLANFLVVDFMIQTNNMFRDLEIFLSFFI